MTMKRSKLSYLLIGVIIIIIVTIGVLLTGVSSGQKEEVIYFISKTNSENSTFWHSVERGVKVAADEIGVELIFLGPEREIDFDGQIKYVRDSIEMEPMAIILAASDYNALSGVALEVMAEDIVFLTVDSDVNISNDHSFIATNNVEAAKILGEELAQYMGETGTVGIISHLKGATSAIDREQGFKQGIDKYTGINVIQEIPYSSNDALTAYEKTKEFLEEYPETTGLFGTNEATLIGIAMAIEELEGSEEISVVGFDISEAAATYIEKGVIDAIIVQRPFNMGYLSVMEAYRQIKGGRSTDFIDVDVVLVNKDNIFDEENQRFIIPFLE